jgi:pilus assembly protein Flp/PilA
MKRLAPMFRLFAREDCLAINLFTKTIINRSGATAIEYGLIAALIAVAAVVVMGQVGTNLSSTFNTVATLL